MQPHFCESVPIASSDTTAVTADAVPALCAILSCSSNKLQQLPPGISALSALKLLDLSDNPLGSLPDDIASLPALASLSCSNCNIPALPDTLGVQQPTLTAVNASGNQLTAVPAGLRAASSLAVLNLAKNQLTDVSAVAEYQSLKELDVSYNKLQVCAAGICCKCSRQ